MKASKLFIPVIILLFLTSCKSADKKINPEQWTDEQVATWFNQKEWLGQTALQVDSSLDKENLPSNITNTKTDGTRPLIFLKRKIWQLYRQAIIHWMTKMCSSSVQSISQKIGIRFCLKTIKIMLTSIT